jgi:hypothetical protein
MLGTVSGNASGLVLYYNFDIGTPAGSNPGLNIVQDQTQNANNGTLNNFALTGATSNWVESYAMVVPTATSATSLGSASFTANWTAPAVGTVDNGYRLDVSTSSTFASFVSGYNGLTVAGTSQSVTGLSSATTYYYRVRADKTSVTGQGGYSSNITTLTLSTNANLSALTTTAGAITPVFASATTAYTASVSNAITSVTVTPTVADATATVEVKVNAGGYSTVISGNASSALSLNLGSNTIDVKVTAEDGSTIKTYTITVTRAFVAPGNTLNFNGTSQSVTLNNTLGNFGTSDFTIEAWFRTTSAGPGSIVSKRVGCGPLNNISITVASSILNMEISGSSGGQYTVIFGTTNVTDGKWHHVAGQRVGSVIKLFLDGIPDASNVAVVGSPTLSNAGNFTIGNTSCNYYFNGNIDEVRVYNTALSQANIQADMFSTTSSVPASLQAYYNFDASSGTALTDQTANGNNGSLVNAPSWVESYAMVVPTATAATSLGSASFTANWTAPVVGTVDNGYRLDVSTSSTFASFVSGYNGLTVAGTSQSVTGLSSATTYYYRVRADKTSVTGQGGYSSNITTLTLSTNANLSALTTTAGAITPVFASATTAYTASVSNAITSVTVTPTVADATATVEVKVNAGGYSTVISGNASSALSLNVGSNTIDVKVTAEDGTTIKTYTITVTRAYAPPGNALDFNGGQYVRTNNIIIAQPYTIETWVMYKQGVARICATDNNNLIIDDYDGAKQIRCYVSLTTLLSKPNVVEYNKWMHVACVVDGGNSKIYVNGVDVTLSGSLPTTALNASSFDLGISGPPLNQVPLYGKMDEFRVWSTARTATEIKDNMLGTVSGNASGLVLYYNFDIGTPAGSNPGLNIVQDQTANANNGTLNNFALTGATSNWITSTAWNTWTGNTNADYATATNWQLGTVPTANDNIVIPIGASNLPVTVTTAQGFYNAQIQSAASLTNTNTLSITGNLFNSGTLTSTAGTIAYTGTTPQTIAASTFAGNTVQEININNTAGVTLAGALNVTGTLTSTAGTFATGGFLTLKSTSIANTARIAPVSGSITGNVTVERYIPAGKRSFRFLTPGVTTASTIKANWQEGATSATSNPTAGYGTHITGTTVDQTNGFDATSTGGASLYLFNNATQAWSSISNTHVNTLASGTAYRVLVRGDRSTDLTTQPSTNTATTLRATGVVTTGTVTLGSSSSMPASMPTLASGASEFSFIANPYVSAIDWNALSKTGLTGYYYIWDPTLATRGAYVSCFTDGTKSNGSSAITTAIQNGQAFFVQNTAGVSSRQLVITEANKTTGNTNVYRTQTGTSSLSVQLYLTANINVGSSQDGATALFNNSYDNAVNDDDAGKFTNQDENLAIQRGNSLMSIERRNVPVNPNDTMFLKMWQITQNNYTFKVDANNFDAGLTAVLVDNYLNIETPISLSGITNINFTTNAIAGSTATNRFSVVFKSSNALPTNFLNVSAAQKDAGIEVNFTTANETNMASYDVEESNDGTTFIKGTTVIAKNATTNNYNWLDASVVNGNNYYRIKAIEKNGTTKYSNVVNVKIGGNIKNNFTIVVNPIKNKQLSLQFENVEKASYSIKVINMLGQVITNKSIQHNGGSATETINLINTQTGIYQLSIIGNNNVNVTKTFIVE